MIADRDGRSPAPKQIGLCSLGTRLVATHRGGSWFWRHYTECKCPDYQPWETSTEARREQLMQMASEGFATPELAEEFRTAALEFLTGVGKVEGKGWSSDQAILALRQSYFITELRNEIEVLQKKCAGHQGEIEKLRYSHSLETAGLRKSLCEDHASRKRDAGIIEALRDESAEKRIEYFTGLRAKNDRIKALEAELKEAKSLIGVTEVDLITKGKEREAEYKAEVKSLEVSLKDAVERNKDVEFRAEWNYNKALEVSSLKSKLAETEAKLDKVSKQAANHALMFKNVIGVVPSDNHSDKDFACLVVHAARNGSLFKGFQNPSSDDERNPLQIAYDKGYEAGSRKKSA